MVPEALSNMPYRELDFTEVEALLHRVEQSVKERHQPQVFLETMRELEARLIECEEMCVLALDKSIHADTAQNYYQAEYEKCTAFLHQMTERKQSVYIELLHSPDLAYIARQTGPLFLYRQQNAEIFSRAEQLSADSLNSDLGGTLDHLTDDSTEEPMAITDHRPSTNDEEILARLISDRTELAVQRGFKDYLEYAWLKQERFDYGQPDRISIEEQVKQYLVPIAAAYRAYWSSAPEAINPSSFDRTFPQAPTLHAHTTLEELVGLFALCWPEWDSSKVIIRADYNPKRRTKCHVQMLPKQGIAIIEGSYRYDMRSIHRLWTVMSEALIRTHQANKHWLKENRQPTPEVLRAMSVSMATLTMDDPKTASLWGHELHACVSMQLAWHLLFDLLGYFMRDTYETHLYAAPNDRIDHRRLLWKSIAKTFWPGDVTSLDYPYFALRYVRTVHELKTHEVGDYFTRVIGCLTALLVRDQERLDRGSGYKAMRTFISECGQLPMRSLFDISGLPSLFHPDSLKRPAYQLAYQLGL